MRKTHVTVTVDLLIEADDAANLAEVVESWASGETSDDAEVQVAEILDWTVTDSR